MSNCINQLLQNLNEEINTIESGFDDILVKIDKGLAASKSGLSCIREHVAQSKFKSEQEEIHFFKVQKPQALSQLIYYANLDQIEKRRPMGSIKNLTKYFEIEIKKRQEYFTDNREFYIYFRKEQTCFDRQYFIRENGKLNIGTGNLLFCCDDDFTTSRDHSVATFLAYKKIIEYLQLEISKLDSNFNLQNKNSQESLYPLLNWSGSKVDLVELIYAFHITGAINGGRVGIKELASKFEQIFNIEIGDCYRIFLELKLRKVNKTKFIDSLKDGLIKRIEDGDE